MGQVLLRRTTKATHSVDEAAALVRTLTNARVVGQSGDNVLAEVDAPGIAALQERLPGWIVSPQGEKIPVPDTRRKIP